MINWAVVITTAIIAISLTAGVTAILVVLGAAKCEKERNKFKGDAHDDTRYKE